MTSKEDVKIATIIGFVVLALLGSLIWSVALYTYRAQDLERDAIKAGLMQTLTPSGHVLWVHSPPEKQP